MLCNLDNIGPAVGGLARSVARIYLGDAVAAPSASSATATPPHVSLSAEQLASKVGLYRDPSNDTFGRIFVRHSKLMATGGAGEDGGVELTAMTAHRFIVPNTPVALEFVAAGAGPAQQLQIVGEGPKPIVMKRIDETFSPSSAALRALAGEYTNSELEVTYTVAERHSNLIIQMPGKRDIALQPLFADVFWGALVDLVKFSRDAGGVVTGFSIKTQGVRNLRFDRTKP